MVLAERRGRHHAVAHFQRARRMRVHSPTAKAVVPREGGWIYPQLKAVEVSLMVNPTLDNAVRPTDPAAKESPSPAQGAPSPSNKTLEPGQATLPQIDRKAFQDGILTLAGDLDNPNSLELYDQLIERIKEKSTDLINQGEWYIKRHGRPNWEAEKKNLEDLQSQLENNIQDIFIELDGDSEVDFAGLSSKLSPETPTEALRVCEELVKLKERAAKLKPEKQLPFLRDGINELAREGGDTSQRESAKGERIQDPREVRAEAQMIFAQSNLGQDFNAYLQGITSDVQKQQKLCEILVSSNGTYAEKIEFLANLKALKDSQRVRVEGIDRLIENVYKSLDEGTIGGLFSEARVAKKILDEGRLPMGSKMELSVQFNEYRGKNHHKQGRHQDVDKVVDREFDIVIRLPLPAKKMVFIEVKTTVDRFCKTNTKNRDITKNQIYLQLKEAAERGKLFKRNPCMLIVIDQTNKQMRNRAAVGESANEILDKAMMKLSQDDRVLAGLLKYGKLEEAPQVISIEDLADRFF